MTKKRGNRMERAFRALSLASLLTMAAVGSASAQQEDGKPSSSAAAVPEEHYQIPRQNWTFGGLLGYFDEQQLRRGYLVYKSVCANCHNMRLLSYRNLGQPGGPAFPKEEVEAIAAEVQVADGYNDQGAVNMRPGKPSDPFQWRFKNEKEAAAALNGAVPPDLSLMAKARTVEREFAWYAFPYIMLKDLATQYQEQGPDYIYALLTGYSDPPPGDKVAEGLYYDKAFPGHQLAMPQPLTDGAVDYADKTPNTLDQEARDVTAFLAWAAEPHLVERKKLGLWVLIYLGVLAVLLFIAKKTLWRNIEH
jgi:ubiquinol-cytochrome c reductase cytochrome c1 subunit